MNVDWPSVKIAEITESINPGFPSGQHNQENRGVPHLRPMNISRTGEIDLSVVKYVESNDGLFLHKDDVLFNNTNSPELVGKTTYIPRDTNWVYSNHMTRLKLRQDIASASWVAHTLHYLFLSGYFKLICRNHVNQASISSGVLSQVEIPLPPLPEQERIVGRIEELFSQLQAGEAALRRAEAGLKRYRAAVLKAACEGRLAPQDPADESAEALLRRLGKQPAPVQAPLPPGWCWARTEDLACVGTGATPLRSKVKYWENGTIPWITSSSVNRLEILQADEFITDIAVNETNAKLFPSGSLVVAMYGEGKTRGKISELKISAATNQACAVLTFGELTELCKPYLKIFYLNNYENIRRRSSGGVQPNLNLSIIRNTVIPLPPLAEQQRIVAEVERRLAGAAQAGQGVGRALARARRLRQSILKRAFEGRLT